MSFLVLAQQEQLLDRDALIAAARRVRRTCLEHDALPVTGSIVSALAVRLRPAPMPPPALGGGGVRTVSAFEPLMMATFTAPHLDLLTQHALGELGESMRAQFGIDDLWQVTDSLVLDVPGAITKTALARVGFMNAPDHMSTEQFGEHWRRKHVPIVIRNGPLFERYSLHVAHDEAMPFDGMVVQWFPGRHAWAEHDRLINSEKTEVRDDIHRFVASSVQFEGTAPTDAEAAD